MKKIIFLGLITLFLSACNNNAQVSDDTSAVTEPDTSTEVTEERSPNGDISGAQAAWKGLTSSAEARDCDAFSGFLTDNVETSPEICEVAFDAFAQGAPELDWDITEFNADQTEAQVYIKAEDNDIILLTIFVQEDDGIWRAASRFWPETL